MNQRDRILERVSDVPALPISAVKVIATLQNAAADLSEISRVIQCDPGLTAGLLRLANSALFGSRRDITSLDNAIAWLGTRRILDLVVGSTIKPMATKQIRGYDLAAGELWRHSVAVACGSEELAKVLDMRVPGSAFAAGLLIDIGKSILGIELQIDGAEIQSRAFDRQLSFEQAEREVLGTDHAEVGAALLDHWDLPEEIISVVRWHHEPQFCPRRYRGVMNLVHASDLICTISGMGTGIDGLNYTACESVMQTLDLQPQHIERALSRIAGRMELLEDVLNDETGS